VGKIYCFAVRILGTKMIINTPIVPKKPIFQIGSGIETIMSMIGGKMT